MDVLLAAASLAAAGYLVSLSLHPYTACRACRGTPGRHRGVIFRYAFRKCTRCKGTGRKLRLGARVLLGRTEGT